MDESTAYIVNPIDKEDYYHSQLNNRINPYGACNITALNMIFDYLGISYTDDEVMMMTRSNRIINWYRKILLRIFGTSYIKNKKLNKIWKVLEKIANDVFKLNDVNFQAMFVSFNDIYDIIIYLKETNIPVMVSTRFTSSGHIVVVNGVKIKDNEITHIIIHDSYGDVNSNYKNKNGRYISVPIDYFKKKIKLDRGLVFKKLGGI